MEHFLNALRQFDYKTVSAATDLTASHEWLALLVFFVSEVAVFFFPLLLLYLWGRPELPSKHYGSKKAVVIALVSLVLTLAIKSVIEYVFYRSRPFISHPDLFVTSLPSDGSFPSGHTMFAFSIAMSMYLSGYKKLGWWSLGLAALVGLSRVFAGVHYPLDIIAGAIIGVFSAWYLHREASGLKRYLPNS